MIDARYIEAKRRAAKGEGAGNSRRRPRGGAARTPANSVSPPSNPVDPPPPKKPESLQPSPELSPRMPARPVVVSRSSPPKAVTILQKGGQGGTTVTSVINPLDSLDRATANLSLQETQAPPKQSRRGRNRGRPNLSRQSSPQKTFQPRTSSEDHRSGTTNRGMSIGSPNLRGVLPITMAVGQASPIQETGMPVVRLPDMAHPPESTQSHDTGNLIQSEDTDFGSDISRGAVREGRLYNHKTNEKPAITSRQRENQRSPRVKPIDEKPEQPQRGVLRIQPGKLDAPKPPPQQTQQQPSGHRGGLLFIGNAIKPTNNNTNNNTKPKKAPPARSNEFNRNAVPLRKDAEPSPRVIWNPDNISPHTLSHSGPPLKLTSEDILREVKSAYQNIQTLERKVKSCYESKDDAYEMTRLEQRPTTDGVTWSTYAKTHRELLEQYHTFFIMTQHPSALASVRRLPKKHDLLARYWKYGIVQLVEYLRCKLPLSEQHLQSFIFAAYTLTSVLLHDVPVFTAVWQEMLGDLARYLYAIEENEVEDKDHWKEVAMGWYLRTSDFGHGLEGRLYHHLGILNKEPLTQLFYYAKSLTVVRGFTSARESFLVLIDPMMGKKWSDWNRSFVRLHGMLFARLQLDSFDDELDESYNTFNGGKELTEVDWPRVAVLNLAALYQYNRRDSLLKEALRQGRREKREAEQEEAIPVEDSTEPDTNILPASQTENLSMDMLNDCPPEYLTNIPADIRSGDQDDVPLSKIVFEKSRNLTCSLFSEILNSHVEDEGPRMYVHVMLVFLGYALRYQPVVRLLERRIPWQELSEYLSDVYEEYLDSLDERLEKELPLQELCGPVLVEDTVMRGFEWSRKQFPKGWFQNVDSLFEDLECTDDGWRTKSDEPLAWDPDPEEGKYASYGPGPDAASVTNKQKEVTARKQRVLTLGIQISKICDCLEFEDTRFRVSEAVKTRIAAAEEEEAREAERLEAAAQAAREAAMMESLVEEAQDQHESDEDADVEGESEELRSLKARRRELKALLNAQRPENKKSAPKQSKKDKSTRKAMKPGYTILVFDTNLLVSHLDLLKQVIDSGDWPVVVPLIVINELDGLKVNPPPLGPAAADAVTYVEQALLARRLRVITQQGNGLSNLALRSQQLISKNTEDGAGNIDAFIIETVKDQVEKHSGKLPAAEKAVLITGDRSMRVISKARGVQALTAVELRKEIFKKGEKSHDPPKKKAWG